MSLGTNAIIFFLNDHRLRGVLEDFRSRLRGSGQHKINGMKQPEAHRFEFVAKRALQCLADIAQQHIGATYGSDWTFVGLGDGLFDKTLAQTDAQVAGHDLDDVFHYAGLGLCQQAAN